MKKKRKNKLKLVSTNDEKSATFQEIVFKRRRLAMCILISALIFSFLGIQLKINYDKSELASNIQKELKKSQADLKTKQRKLKKQAHLLEDDDYVAKLARSKFYFSKKGESIYTLPEGIQDINGKVVSRKKKEN